jgi:hypothetical protein
MLQMNFTFTFTFFLCKPFVTQTNVHPMMYQVKSFVSGKGKNSVSVRTVCTGDTVVRVVTGLRYRMDGPGFEPL